MRRCAAALAALTAACGSQTTGPAPTPSPPSFVRVTAEGLPSPFHMTLRAHLGLEALIPPAPEPARPSSGSACWGYTAPDGRRFALVGTSAGLAIVEVTDPERAHEVGFVPGGHSAWREVKAYRDHVYVSTEARTGLDVIDMGDPDYPRKVQTLDRTFTSAHTVWVDTERGLLFANGTTSGMHVLDVGSDPDDPPDVGSFTAFYVHDAYTRGTTLYASAIQNGFLALLDVSDPARIREITRFTTGGSFTHNSWLTDDGRYLFTTDEVPDRPVEGWDMADPTHPVKVSEYIARRGVIPHNVLIDGNRLVLSHYTEGVHLLDVQDPTHPRVLGTYDTYDGAGTGFHGCWGAYIFPGSDLIVASDIEGGLFVVSYTP